MLAYGFNIKSMLLAVAGLLVRAMRYTAEKQKHAGVHVREKQRREMELLCTIPPGSNPSSLRANSILQDLTQSLKKDLNPFMRVVSHNLITPSQ